MLRNIGTAAFGGLVLLLFGFATASLAGEKTFFRIGTGGVGGTYYPIGGIIANAISSPPGSRPCDKGGSCGVPGLLAIAQSSHGSVANIEAIADGRLESGFAQSDIAYWAYTGTGIFEGRSPARGLRAIANLYPESVHIVIRRGAGITSLRDLKGRRVSIDEPGSGTLVDARIILRAFGLDERRDLKVRYLKGSPAALRLRSGQLDAFFAVAGYPEEAVVSAVSGGYATLLPLAGPEIDRLLAEHRYFARDRIPAGVYPGVGEIPTISVNALWLVSAKVDDDLVYQITKALWNDQTRALLANGHEKGKMITLETALDGIGIPLHPGAQRYYREVGLLR